MELTAAWSRSTTRASTYPPTIRLLRRSVGTQSICSVIPIPKSPELQTSPDLRRRSARICSQVKPYRSRRTDPVQRGAENSAPHFWNEFYSGKLVLARINYDFMVGSARGGTF